jgi:hypothetical protein
MDLFAGKFCSVYLQNFVLALRSYIMGIMASDLKVLQSVNAPCSYSVEQFIQAKVTWPQVAAEVEHNQDGQKENVAANNVGRSLALETRDWSVGMYKKLPLETSFNLQLLRSTHNIESEFKIWVCVSECKSGFQCREKIFPNLDHLKILQWRLYFVIIKQINPPYNIISKETATFNGLYVVAVICNVFIL